MEEWFKKKKQLLSFYIYFKCSMRTLKDNLEDIFETISDIKIKKIYIQWTKFLNFQQNNYKNNLNYFEIFFSYLFTIDNPFKPKKFD